jgi:integrase
MSINKVNGRYLVRLDRKGMPRVSRKFESKASAEEFEREFIKLHNPSGLLNVVTTMVDARQDNRTLRELIDIWYKYHGINLSDNVRTKASMEAAANAIGNPVARLFNPEDFVNWRFNRLQSGISGKTVNILHGYLSAMFIRLKKLKIIDYANPLEEVEFIKLQERQMSYLSKSQIQLLLETIKSGAVNQSTWYVTQICLRTGARWSEAEQLKRKQLHDCRVTYEFTKSKRTRTVPLDADFYAKLLVFCGYKNPDDRIFTNCIGSYTRSVKRAEINMPRGQKSHILRHSFASHFMINGGNILSLQKILGHSDITQTMKYAHLSPDHLNDAVKLNPLA